MVVQVGDKVLVYGAGTPWAFAKKIEPVEVGDKVDVVTLSDGTKLAMPKIELDLSEYVWVVPEFDTPFNIGDVPSRWGMMPLGAAVFTISRLLPGIIEDEYREWESGDLTGMLLFNLSARKRSSQFIMHEIMNNTETRYNVLSELVYPLDLGLTDESEWTLTRSGGTGPASISGGYAEFDIVGGIGMAFSQSPRTIMGLRTLRTSYKYIIPGHDYLTTSSPVIGVGFQRLPYGGTDYPLKPWGHAPTGLTDRKFISGTPVYEDGVLLGYTYDEYPDPISAATAMVNLAYPDFDNISVAITDDVKFFYNVTMYVSFYNTYNGTGKGWVGAIELLDETGTPLTMPYPTNCVVGDQYVIYDPVTKRLQFNDANKAILSAAYWRDIEIPGEEISTSSVTYAWDGVGTVYLSQLKYTQSTIFYDNELRVDATAAGATKTIPYHTSDPYVIDGETVSRELVNITSILRAGKNDIVLTVRSSAGTKIGFPTPVYILRSLV